MPFHERQPYIQPLYQIVGEVLQGDIRVPRFQRPGTETTWSAEKRGDLLDSLYRGFPIGTILLWSTKQPISTLEDVGGFRIRQASSGAGQRLLLDGHQRLSTLVQILGPGLIGDMGITDVQHGRSNASDAQDQERWVFELDAEAESTRSRDRFVLLKRDQEPTPTQLPLGTALDRKALNRWIRERETDLSDSQVTAADTLRDQLREYSIPVAVLVADSLLDATESFKRINSSGVPMNDFNMVTALVYQDGFDPQDLFEQHRGDLLEPLGWVDVSDSDILRVCAALAKQHPAKMKVDTLASRLREDSDLIPRAFRTVTGAAKALIDTCGIHGPGALPYSWQLITLSTWLGTSKQDAFPETAYDAVQRWFWLTTYGEVFGGVNSAIYDRSFQALDDMIHSRSRKAMERDLSKTVRPAPRLDFRAARAKAIALMMARYQDGADLSGPAHRALANGVSSMGLLMSRGRRSQWWNLAVIAAGRHVNDYRDALKHRSTDNATHEENKLLDQIGLPGQAQGSIAELLENRCKLLKQEERKFVTNLNLKWTDAD